MPEARKFSATPAISWLPRKVIEVTPWISAKARDPAIPASAPIQAMYACLLFGFFQALALRPDVVERVVQVKVPVPFLDALPYILTVLVLAGFVGKAIPPRAGGEPYVKER